MAPQKKLHRGHEKKQILGVCAALAVFFDISVTLVRLAFIISLFFTGIGLVLYLALWLLIPAQADAPSPLGKLFRGIESDGPSILELWLTRFWQWIKRLDRRDRKHPRPPSSQAGNPRILAENTDNGGGG